MRLDKYLQVSRLVKRRTVANALCNLGRVKLNSHPAKASRQVQVGDQVEVDFGSHRIIARVTAVSEGKRRAAGTLYEVVERITKDW